MPTLESWFRPWLDDPGPWEAWEFVPEEQAGLAALLKEAAAATGERLHALFGDQAELFGAIGLVKRLAGEPPAVEPLLRAALAVAAVDHYRSRVGPSRPEPGGSTNPTNEKRWSTLRPYLMERLRHSLELNTADSLLWRAILGRVPDNWVPAEQIRLSLERQLKESDLFSSVEVALDLRAPIPGGRAWLRAEIAKTLAAIKKSLTDRRPALVEVLRDPMVSPTLAQVVVVYRLEEAEDGWITLECLDPARDERSMALRLKLLEDSVVMHDTPSDDSRPAPKGVRWVTVPHARPPLFGPRRWLRWVLPWSLFWWVKRRWSVFLRRRRERAQRATR